ncbi:MAG TPA: leucine--tRNA ligase, partial [Candidatus Kaiserbacteria bacterium]|nr:leucine--tRNA ligase [Candidatus Kaiserbacteria bacterium]
MASYNHEEIEKKWQKKWEDDGLYNTKDSVSGKDNFYTLVEYPYPSGNLHTGHWYAFAVPDIFARYKRMNGFNVLFPIGFDSFGLPAENAAIKNNVDPKEWTYKNIDTMTAQLKSMGAMFDWSRKVVASDEDYYKWTQWLFLQMHKRGLAYQKEAVVNWDPVDQTVLANEQVLPDGTAERSGAVVEKKKLKQWFLKITDYADRLIEDLDELNWPEQIKQAQREWIGKSEGAEINFPV